MGSQGTTRSFFPTAMISEDGSFHQPFLSPDSKIRGKPSQTVTKSTQSISELFSSVIQKKNFLLDSPAIFHDRKMKLTFRGLDDISTRLAQALSKVMKTSTGLRPNGEGDTVVALLLNDADEVDEKMISIILAILKLGVTYMVLNPESSPNDLLYAINAAKPILLVTGACTSDLKIQEMIEQIKFPIVTAKYRELWVGARVDSVSPDKSIPTLDIADPEYWSDLPLFDRMVGIFFTAGSVGSPHGVRIGAREIYNRLHWQSKVFPVGNSDAFTLTSPPTDPKFLSQMWTPFLAGMPLTIISKHDQENPIQFIERVSESKLTRVTVTPLILERILDAAAQSFNLQNKLSGISHWTVSGNAFTLDIGRKFFQLFSGTYKSGVFLIVMYGTTEVLGEATYEVFFDRHDLETKLAPGSSRMLSVGVPISNSSVAVVDSRDKYLPLDHRGEIVFSGCCLSAGGYVGQGSGAIAKFSINGVSKSSGKTHLLFRTGDIGFISLDKNGIRRLYVEGRMDSRANVEGQSVDLNELVYNIKGTGMVKDVQVLTHLRGRESKVIIAACILKDGVKLPQVMSKLRVIITTPNAILPEVFAIDEIPRLANGRVDKKKLRSIYRDRMLECNEDAWKSLDILPEELHLVKFLCRAIALSLGIPLVDVISHYEANFWDIGGTALNAITTVKICSDNGIPISLEDFVNADSLSQAVEKIQLSSNGSVKPGVWLQDGTLNGKYKYEPMSFKDEDAIIQVIKEDCIGPDMPNTQDIIKYWKEFITKIRNMQMCIVAKTSDNRVVGIAINGDADAKLKVSKPPKDIAYGLELLEACQSVSRYQMWRKTNGRVAQMFFLAIKKSLSQGDAAIITEQLLSRSLIAARTGRFSSVVVTTSNPLIQEAATHLLQFESLLEFPVSRFKAKDKTRPFTYADDHHTASVLIKDISWELRNNYEGSTLTSQVPSVTSGSIGSTSTF